MGDDDRRPGAAVPRKVDGPGDGEAAEGEQEEETGGGGGEEHRRRSTELSGYTLEARQLETDVKLN